MKHFTVSSPFVWQAAPAEVPANQSYTDASSALAKQAPLPLAGRRLAVKDLFDIKGIPTTAGNPAWPNSHALPDTTASAVRKLLQGGAALSGKTITDELAYSLNGQNMHYGTPQNPVTPERLPGGSSSGSATAVAAGLADIGLGTDTGGSIRVPASYNNLYGMRPTHGRISTDGLVALAPGFDTVGVMSKTLDILEASMNCLFDEPLSNAAALTSLTVFQSAIDKCEHAQLANDFLSGLDIAVAPGDFSQLASLPLAESFRVLQGQQIWHTHGDWITAEQPTFAADIDARFKQCADISPAQVNNAKQIQQQVCDIVTALLSNNTAIVLPTTPGTAPLLSAKPDTLVAYRNQLLTLTALAGLAGLPQLHLPLFCLNNAPCGLSLIGPAGSETSLFALARTLTETKV
ncbi:amidase [Alteromonas gilva]|uniref:Amidase n=1 Tax=Alteromonas gilva TaxID=2987522 RepID=A0ABT5L6Q4_9ALTE|nr:amidase [Alteromonas gilva]MDC8831443.1 amidase [Alteromonas gilva]